MPYIKNGNILKIIFTLSDGDNEEIQDIVDDESKYFRNSSLSSLRKQVKSTDFAKLKKEVLAFLDEYAKKGYE